MNPFVLRFLPLSRALLFPSAGLFLVAPGLAQSQNLDANSAPLSLAFSATPSTDSVETARLQARAAMRNGQLEIASALWRQVLQIVPSDAEATHSLSQTLLQLQTRPGLYEGLPATKVTTHIASRRQVIERPATQSTGRPTLQTVSTARESAKLLAQTLGEAPATNELPAPATPLPLPATPNVEIVPTPTVAPAVEPTVAVSAPLKPTPTVVASTSTRRTVAAPALAPLPASTNVSAIRFVAPARKTSTANARRRADAWPFVERAGKLLQANRTSQALALYRRAYALDPANEFAGNGVGTALTIQGKHTEAVRVFRNALAYRPGDARLLRGLANALTYSQKLREAIGVNNVILAKSPNNFAANFQNAQLYTYLRSYASADAAFARAAKVQPNNVALLTARGESLSYRRDPRAINNFRRVLALKPRDVSATLGLANFYSYVGEFSSAIPQYQAVLRRQPNNVTARVALADALTYTSEFDDAAAQYRAALKVQNSNRAARLGLGRALVYAGRSIEGARELGRVLAVEPSNVAALEALAIAQAESSPRQALQTYQTLLIRQTSPAARAKTLVAIGDLRAGNNEFPAAIQAYSQAARLSPRDPAIALSYAQLLTYNNQWEQARPVIETAVALAPNNPRALALQVQVESRVGNAERAQTLATRLENVPPASAEEAIDLADALRETGNAASANRLLTRAAELSNNPATTLKIADSVRDASDYPTAIALYNRLLSSDPNNVAARVGLAQTLSYNRDQVAARAEVQRALAIDPKNEGAQLVLGQINLAEQSKTGQEQAGQIFVDILKTDPNNSDARAGVGQLFSIRGRFADAVTQYRIALASNPNNNEARLGLARNFYYSRDIEASISEYRDLIRRTPADTLPRLELAQIFLDRNRFSDAEALFNEVLAMRQGAAALASVRRAIETRSLARLSPTARNYSPLRKATIARLGKRQVVVNSVALKGSTSNRKILAQNSDTQVPAASGPLAPDLNGAPDAPLSLPTVPSNGSVPEPILGTIPAPTVDAPTALPTAPQAPSPAGNLVSDQVAALRGLGEIRRRQNRLTEAATFFNQALTVDPNDITSRVGLAQTLREQSNFTAALTEANRAVAADATNIPARVIRAQLLADTGDTEGAKTELNSLLGSIPESAPLETYVALVGALNTVENYPAALLLVDAAAQTYPTEPSVSRLKGETLTFARRFDEAEKLYDALIVADPQDVDAVIGKARVYNYSDRLENAETTYRQAFALEPNNYQALVELADVEGRRGDFVTSISLYNQAIALNPSDLATRVSLAKVQRYSLANAEAEATLNQVLEADAKYAPALVERGILRGVQGSYATGIADLQTALAITPNDVNAQIGLAEVQSYAGQYPQSIAGYQAILAKNPANLQARTQLALVQSYAGQTEAALQTVGVALQQNPTDLGARLARADILGRAGRTDESVGLYRAILASDPSNVRARTGMADAYLYGQQYADAVKVYDQLIVAEPTNANFQIQRARALGYGGNSRAAVAALRSIVASQPNNLNARLSLAEAGINSGERNLQNEGIATYRAILASDANNVPAKIGLARGLSYVGSYKPATQALNEVLTTSPNNIEARQALADTQRFSGDPFSARENYKTVLGAQPNNAQARAGFSEAFRNSANSVTGSTFFYRDSNGVRLRSASITPTIRTRALTFGVIAESGRFEQGSVRRDRTNLGFLLARQFGPVAASLVVSRLRYDGAPSRTLYNANLGYARGPRERYGLSIGRQDVFESDLALTRGITAQFYRASLLYPLARKIDFEGTATYYRYSDDNSRINVLPALYYRFKATNPSLRVGVGYNYDDAREQRDVPAFVYYAPQNFSAASLLADYVVDTGRTRYGIFASKSLSSGSGGNRAADTIFGNVEHDLSDNFGVFLNGGYVRAGEDFDSSQINGGATVRF